MLFIAHQPRTEGTFIMWFRYNYNSALPDTQKDGVKSYIKSELALFNNEIRNGLSLYDKVMIYNEVEILNKNSSVFMSYFLSLAKSKGYQINFVDIATTRKKRKNCKKESIREIIEAEWLDCSHLVHGLLRCKNCERVWNRDHNGAMNIYKICRNAVDGKERPILFVLPKTNK